MSLMIDFEPQEWRDAERALIGQGMIAPQGTTTGDTVRALREVAARSSSMRVMWLLYEALMARYRRTLAERDTWCAQASESASRISDAHDFAERVERLSLEAARFNHASPDKTEFIRIWVQARSSRGLPHDAGDWDAAMAGTP